MVELDDTEKAHAEVAYTWRKLAAPQRAPAWARQGAKADPPSDPPGVTDAPTEAELGFEEGLAKGRAQAATEVTERLAVLNELIAEAQVARQTFMAANAQELGDAVGALFKVVFQHELTSSPVLLERLVAEASAMLALDGPVALELHPTDHARLQEALGDEAPECVANDALLPGSVRLVGGEATHELDVAARLQTVLQDFVAASHADSTDLKVDRNDLP